MLFSSLIFLVGFLPLFLTAYYIAPSRARNIVALAGSYLFYAWGAPQIAVVLFLSSVIDFLLVSAIMRLDPVRKNARIGLLATSIVLNLSCLAYFKYANFFVDQVNGLAGMIGWSRVPWSDVALPIGISFFTFHKVSYILDVWRGTAPVARSLLDYCMYIVLFPQLIAGPIIRYHDVADQMLNRTHSLEKFFSGLWRFSIGLAKKVLIANVIATVADAIFEAKGGFLPCSRAWLGVVAYSMQIYFDFSGYSDMAIGLGRMLGFTFLENFNRPYISAGFTEFWRRWHISLSNFMKDYLYIPLGGNRGSRFRTYVNLWIVFLLSGLWHGASWNFVAWGAYHGFFIASERFLSERKMMRLPRFIHIPLTFVLVMAGWVFFRSETLPDAWRYLTSMTGLAVANPSQVPFLFLDNRAVVALVAALVITFFPVGRGLQASARSLPERPWLVAARAAVIMVLIGLSVLSLANLDFNPFIYFRF